MKIITKTERETFAFAQKLAKELKGGEVIGLIGELGAGKTTFTKGFARGLGIKQNITSPTFVLMKIYNTPLIKPACPVGRGVGGIKKITTLCHIDAYRIKTAEDLTAIGAKEYFNDPATITIVEWADKMKKILPQKTRFVYIKNISDNKREIKIN